VADQWFEPITSDPAPSVTHNATNNIINCGGAGGIDLQPGELAFHPGINNEHSVIRWTAPMSGVFSVTSTFQGRDRDGCSTDVHVFHNSLELYIATVSGTGIPQQVALSDLDVSAGDVIDFTVGYGGNGYLNDTTAIDARIALRPGADCGDGNCLPPETVFSCPLDCMFPGKPAAPSAYSSELSKSRFFSIVQSDTGHCIAVRVRFASLHHVSPPYTGGASAPFTLFEGQFMYVGPPMQYVESASSGIQFYAAQLQCAPYYQNWSRVGLLHVTGEAIVPSSSYEVENLAASCAGSESTCTAVSAALEVKTTRWGDVETPWNPPVSDPQPDTSDISALKNKFMSALGAPIKARALLFGDSRGKIDIARDLNFSDISLCVDAFKGLPYPYKPGKCTGVSSVACSEHADCNGGVCVGGTQNGQTCPPATCTGGGVCTPKGPPCILCP